MDFFILNEGLIYCSTLQEYYKLLEMVEEHGARGATIFCIQHDADESYVLQAEELNSI